MEELKSYISTLIIVSVAAGAINVMAPDGNIKKYIKYLISLSVVIILLLPFKNLIYTLPKILESYEIKFAEEEMSVLKSAEELIIDQSVYEIKKNINAVILNRFMIKIEVGDITIDYNADDYENVELNKITVYSDCNDLIARDIERYLTNMMYCEVEVINDG